MCIIRRMMHRTGVTSVILCKLFPLIELRRQVPAMLKAGVKQKLYEPQAASFAARSLHQDGRRGIRP